MGMIEDVLKLEQLKREETEEEKEEIRRKIRMILAGIDVKELQNNIDKMVKEWD